MSTIKQKTAALKTFESIGSPHPKTIGQILLESGYSAATSRGAPKEITSSEGYQTELEKLLKENKIDKNSRLKRMGEIMHDKDKRSAIAAVAEINKMLGDYAPIKQEITDLREKREEITKPD
jgi:galactitol-specific phosphotransferase system IIB component